MGIGITGSIVNVGVNIVVDRTVIKVVVRNPMDVPCKSIGCNVTTQR